MKNKHDAYKNEMIAYFDCDLLDNFCLNPQITPISTY